MAIDRPLTKAAQPLVLSAALALGVFLSFSRGAWLNLALALAIYGWLAYVTAANEERRRRIWRLIGLSVLAVALVIIAALQVDAITALLSERASLTQSYDVGPEGRFGGQEKALALVLENPLGIGATIFSTVHHHEEVHNVYLSMFLNAGWLGGGMFMIMIGWTALLGLRLAFQRSPAQPLVLIAVAAFIANALEGVIIDLDHWRHVYLLMALIWGASSAAARQRGAARSSPS
jgi:hypothetical protein